MKSCPRPPGVGVGVGVGVDVGVVVGVGVGARTLKSLESLDGLYCPATPAKFAAIVMIPVPVGVTWQLALPFELVVPEQLAPLSVKLTDCPDSAEAGFCETSVRFAVNVTG